VSAQQLNQREILVALVAHISRHPWLAGVHERRIVSEHGRDRRRDLPTDPGPVPDPADVALAANAPGDPVLDLSLTPVRHAENAMRRKTLARRLPRDAHRSRDVAAGAPSQQAAVRARGGRSGAELRDRPEPVRSDCSVAAAADHRRCLPAGTCATPGRREPADVLPIGANP
jgi:hypothetical protein